MVADQKRRSSNQAFWWFIICHPRGVYPASAMMPSPAFQRQPVMPSDTTLEWVNKA
jgi:hypothetical protein